MQYELRLAGCNLNQLPRKKRHCKGWFSLPIAQLLKRGRELGIPSPVPGSDPSQPFAECGSAPK